MVPPQIRSTSIRVHPPTPASFPLPLLGSVCGHFYWFGPSCTLGPNQGGGRGLPRLPHGLSLHILCWSVDQKSMWGKKTWGGLGGQLGPKQPLLGSLPQKRGSAACGWALNGHCQTSVWVEDTSLYIGTSLAWLSGDLVESCDPAGSCNRQHTGHPFTFYSGSSKLIRWATPP